MMVKRETKTTIAVRGEAKPRPKPASKDAQAGPAAAPSGKPARTPKAGADAGKPRLLSGGNPQIAKGYGDGPVNAYIEASPGWKSDLGSRLDALIGKTVPGVEKAVKWNSPFYGVERGVWFLSFHGFAKYLKVAFFQGSALKPLPPGASSQPDVRYLDIYENDALDEKQFADWVRQASKLGGVKM